MEKKKIELLGSNGEPVLKGELADSFLTRFRGLMFRKSIPDGWGLMITPCNQIHMFNMRFPLDIVYLSKVGEVVLVDKNVPIGKVCKAVKEAHSVVEINAGTAESLNIKAGDTLTVRAE